MKLNKILIIIILIAIVAIFFAWKSEISGIFTNQTKPQPEQELKDKIVSLEIAEGSTYGKLMEQAGIGVATATAIFNAAADVYDLSKVRLERTIDLIYDRETDELKELVYQIDSEEKLVVSLDRSTTTPQWLARRELIPYEIKIKTARGEIETSMYESALAQNLDERSIIALAEAFQWTIDFSLDVRQGDTYEFIFEERYLAGGYVMPGNILAGKFINDGTPYYVFYFEESKDKYGYYDESGNSVQKIFLKAPVAYKYISSGFTTGARYIQAFNISTGHRAIDYAANHGTPIRSVGDGTVVFSGWNGAYGYMVSVRHNSTYTTNYAHMSRLAVKSGQKVSQSQTIGYVGSTGLSTGPHVHYEMVKNGVKINPLRETLPPGEPIAAEKKQGFLEIVNRYKNQLQKWRQRQCPPNNWQSFIWR